MSSDDSGDSGFDKEAEREKLREKYEQDEADRENTRRMSELLLQGATMTGKHCGECGDPIFRYDGQEFCPTCQREVEGGGSEQGSAPQQDDAQRRASAESDTDRAGEAAAETEDAPETDEEITEDGETGDERTDDEPRVEINDVRVADKHADTSNVRRPPSQQGESADRSRRNASRGDERGRMRRHDHDHRTNASGRAPASDVSEGDLGEARDALVRKLTDLAHRAEETDDVARARDLLAATREAAEALDALDRANR